MNIKKTKIYNNHIELVKLGENKWAMRDYVYPSFQANHNYWWFCGSLGAAKHKWVFTMKQEDVKIMTYRQVMKIAKEYNEFLDRSEWF